MTTEKLYYKSAYIKEFSASVLECTRCDGGYLAVLDRTAFFPEEGGQTADKGTIGDATVKDVRERDSVIYHLCDKPLDVGREYDCAIDFADRFDKMQQHTAEHILSGLLHSLYGIENVGFHLGHADVTFDTDKPVSQEMLAEVEALANEAVFRDVPVSCEIYPEGGAGIPYRSKMEIDEELRLVKIEGYDVCACCAPHVSSSGQIGLIKLIYSEGHKGGCRIYMLAGRRAYEYIVLLQSNAKYISNLLCAKIEDIGKETEALLERISARDSLLAEKNSLIVDLYSDAVHQTEGNLVVELKGLDITGAREFANRVKSRIGGFLVCLTGDRGSYKYLICHSDEEELKSRLKDANSALMGRGGGRGNMVQGSFAADLEMINAYFA